MDVSTSLTEPRVLKQPPWLMAENGSGTAIAVLDSGISLLHPDMQNVSLKETRSFTDNEPSVDVLGHGTECCSILMAGASHGGPGGIAQGVHLFLGQIIEPSGTGPVDRLCAALEWVANLGVDILAIPSGRMTDDSNLRQLLDIILENGTIVIAPVGNPYNGQKGPLFPAAYPEVVGVGSEAFIESYTTWPEPPDVIMSNHKLPVCILTGGYRISNDTSQATMIVAGYACLLVQKYRDAGKPRMTRDTFLSSLPPLTSSLVRP